MRAERCWVPKLETPFKHSILCTENFNLRCSTFGIDPASNSVAVPQLTIYREKYFRFLNPLLPLKTILPFVPQVTSSRETRLGIAPRISRSSGPMQYMLSSNSLRFPSELIQTCTLSMKQKVMWSFWMLQRAVGRQDSIDSGRYHGNSSWQSWMSGW